MRGLWNPGELSNPSKQTVGCHTEPASHIGNAVASIYYLFNSYYPKLVRISLKSILFNALCHFKVPFGTVNWWRRRELRLDSK